MVIPGQRVPLAAVVHELQGAAWRMELAFDGLAPARKRRLQGFLGSLYGPLGTVQVPDWDHDYDTDSRGLGGGASGSITATGSKDARIIALAGVGGTAPHFLYGDRIGIGGRVYMVCQDATAASGSIGSLSIAPRLREDAAAAPVALAGLTIDMRLLDDAQTMFDIAPEGTASKPLTLVEVL
jgi:hypothetical protein